MAKPPGEPGNGAKSDGQPGETSTSRNMDSLRADTLREVLDRCQAAQATADKLGEKFLSYLLAMAIEEARAAVSRISRSMVQPD